MSRTIITRISKGVLIPRILAPIYSICVIPKRNFEIIRKIPQFGAHTLFRQPTLNPGNLTKQRFTPLARIQLPVTPQNNYLGNKRCFGSRSDASDTSNTSRSDASDTSDTSCHELSLSELASVTRDIITIVIGGIMLIVGVGMIVASILYGVLVILEILGIVNSE